MKKVKLTAMEIEWLEEKWDGYRKAGHPEWVEIEKESTADVAAQLWPFWAFEAKLTLGDAEARYNAIATAGYSF